MINIETYSNSVNGHLLEIVERKEKWHPDYICLDLATGKYPIC